MTEYASLRVDLSRLEILCCPFIFNLSCFFFVVGGFWNKNHTHENNNMCRFA